MIISSTSVNLLRGCFIIVRYNRYYKATTWNCDCDAIWIENRTCEKIGIEMKKKIRAGGGKSRRKWSFNYAPDDAETNSRVYKLYRRLKVSRGGCSFCPPHGGENRRRTPKDVRSSSIAHFLDQLIIYFLNQSTAFLTSQELPKESIIFHYFRSTPVKNLPLFWLIFRYNRTTGVPRV